jgi:choloylglycine hydrolase
MIYSHKNRQEVIVAGFRFGFSFACVIIISLVLSLPGYACTTFVIGEPDNQLFGRSYDFDFNDGYIMVNKRGFNKKAYPATTTDEQGQPAAWSSKYGSVTFNQFGRDFPQGGMNEAGLIIETMSLTNTRNPQPDDRPYVRSANLWRQYILDTCASVAEVLDSDSKIRISYDASKGIGAHFLVLDREGATAVIEFLDGKMVVYSGDSLPIRALTNDTYEDSITHWKNKSAPASDRFNSIQRFVTAANMTRDYRATKPYSGMDYTFDILAAVALPQTRWNIVYDNRNMKIDFRTDGNPKMRSIDVNRFDFSCKTPVKVLDVNAELAGDVTGAFVDYTPDININLTKTSFTKLESRIKVPPQVVELLGKYPEQFTSEE